MYRGENFRKLFCIAALLLTVAIAPVLTVSNITWAAEPNYADKAMIDAEKARGEAQKAIEDAEKAIEDAEKAMEMAKKTKAEAKEQKAQAMEKMVQHGYFPADISMQALDGKVSAVFSHKKHTERESLRCIECHPKVFIMKVGKNVVKGGNLTMDEMKKGKYCGNCHNGHKAFSVTSIQHCKRCHPKQ